MSGGFGARLRARLGLAHGVDGAVDDLEAGPRLHRLDGQDAAEGAGPGTPMHQSEHVPGHGGEMDTLPQPRRHIGPIAVDRLEGVDIGRGAYTEPDDDATMGTFGNGPG